nr:hypothetical protein [Tanacetum cinerariifolium]
MLHISPRVPGQSFAELPFEEEILEFLMFLGHSAQIKTLTDVNFNKLYQPWRSFAAVINKNVDYGFLIWEDLMYQVEHKNQKKSNKMYYPRFTKAYKEYYACATGEATPKPKASARKKRGGSASSTTPPTPIATPTPTTTVVAAPRLSAAAKGKKPARATSPTDPSYVEQTEAKQLKIVLRRSRHEMHISQQGGSGTDQGTGSKPGVLDVPSDDSKDELSWNSFDDEDVDKQTKGRDESEGEKIDESDNDDDDQEEAEKVNDDDDDEDEVPKIDEQETTESGEGVDEETESDGESEEEEITEKEEESFDLIPRTPEESEDDGNGEEDQGLRISEEERIQEEEEADELYRDVDINQGRGLQTIDPCMESIFTTGSSTITPIPSPQSTMTSSIISTFTTASQLPIPPTPIPSLDLQNLPTFVSVFRFEDRVKLLEVNFSNIPGIVNQYMHQQMPKAVREAVQTQTDRLQDSNQRENDEFLKTINENMKKIIKEQVKTQVKAQVTRILPRIKESVNAQLEAEVLTRSSHSSRTSYAVAADLGIVTHWFTLIVLSALRRSDNENILSLAILILMSILTDLQGTLKGKWRYLIPAKPPIHNH